MYICSGLFSCNFFVLYLCPVELIGCFALGEEAFPVGITRLAPCVD